MTLQSCPVSDLGIEGVDRAGERKHEKRKPLIGFVSLLSSGAVSAVGFMLIASQRWSLFDEKLAAFIILFVQWQLLGVTICKLGIEQLVFAVVSKDGNKYFDVNKFILKVVLPASFVYAVVVSIVFSSWAGCVACATIVLDAYSIIIMADLNARGCYKITSVSNLLNYPLFFMILFSLSFTGWLTAEVALAIFLVSSLLRSLWLARNKCVPTQFTLFSSNVHAKMGVQQTLNFLLYRLDQIILAIIGLKLQSDQFSMYIYMAKFPEILSSVIVIIGTVSFPKAYIRYPFTLEGMMSQLKRYRLYLVGYLLALMTLLYAYMKLWIGQADPLYLAPPFLLHALLMLFANNVTYSMLRQGYLGKLILNLSMAVAIGGLVSISGGAVSIYVLSWIVPLQLATFMATSLAANWGKRIELQA